MIRVIVAAVAALLIATALAPSVHAADEPLTRSDVERIVKEYLLANPELLEEVFTALQQKREAQADAARTASLSQYREALEASPNDPVLGNPEGDVTLVEFFDYNCGYCRRAMADLDQLLEDDPDLRVVLKEFPVLGRSSMEAASVSIAVNQVAPEAFEEFHRRLMSSQGEANEDVALALVDEMGLPREQVEAQISSDVVRSVVERSYEIAQALGLSGTPSYVIGNDVQFGAVGYDTLRQSVNEARCGAASC
jgi:protein-disulfide isomerase